MSICAHVYLWVWACLHVSDWQSEVNLGRLPLLLSLSFSFKTGPFSNWMLAVQAGSPVSSWDLPDSTYQCAGVTGICDHAWFLFGCWAFKHRFSCLCNKCVYPLNRLFNSIYFSWVRNLIRSEWQEVPEKARGVLKKICGEQPESLEGIRGEQP